jgi:tetratricopeptide (TPR) repeat protein/phage tail protein X
MPSRHFLVLAIGALLLGGCEQKALDPNLQYEDARNPFVQKAEESLQAKNYPEAVNYYEEALRANPKLAQPHYELGRIYSDRLADSVSALYHYQKFLKLSADTEKKQTVQTLLENERITYAALVPNSPLQNAEAFARLQSENANLKKQLEEANALLAHRLSGGGVPVEPVPQATAAAAVGAPAGPAAPPAPGAVEVRPAPSSAAQTPAIAPAISGGSRTYTIQQGDSLWKISSRFYPGDTKNGVERIKEANREALPEGKPLKIGTIITIPQK